MKHKALSEPKPFKAFRDKYLAAIMMVAALLISSIASAQSDSTKYTPINGYGFRYKRMAFDSVLMVPRSTSPHTPWRAGGIRYNAADSTLQLWTGNQWNSIVTGVGNGIDTAYMINDTTLTIETPDADYFLIIPGRTYTNASATGDTLLISNQIKRLNPGYGITHTIAAGNITQRVDTTTGKIATQRAVRDSMMLAINNISLVSRLDFIHEGANSTTYQNDTLIGKQIIFFTIESYPVGFIERSNSIWCEFDSETGTITLTNGAFYNDDHVIILYRTTPIFLLDENGTPVRDENGNFIILN